VRVKWNLAGDWCARNGVIHAATGTSGLVPGGTVAYSRTQKPPDSAGQRGYGHRHGATDRHDPAAMSALAGAEQDPPQQVSLGDLDLDPGYLDRPGDSLDAVVRAAAGPAPVRWYLAEDVAARVSERGWRTVAATPTRTVTTIDPPQTVPARTVLAAPAPGVDGSWILVELRQVPPDTGHSQAVQLPPWSASSDGKPLRLRPGKAQRRQGVTLAWGGTLVVVEGTKPELTVYLSNTGTSTWHADPDDDCWVNAWLTEEDGGPEEHFGWFALGWAPPLPNLPRGCGVTLGAWVSSWPIKETTPGRYGLVASLGSLGRRTAVRPLEIVVDPRKAAPQD